ncbi:hypothetical protein, partial [Streptosporangium saharense]|uniref:hypothetical protein n=1 Tax=Streptosporangium saharense TaxID=1706840 RepID=UPI001C86C459
MIWPRGGFREAGQVIRYGGRGRGRCGRSRLGVQLGNRTSLGGHQRNHLARCDLHRRPGSGKDLRAVLTAGLETGVHQQPGRLHVLVPVLL